MGEDSYMLPHLSDFDLDTLRRRYEELDAFAQSLEICPPNIEEIRASVFFLGGSEEDEWNNYHLVRNEYDRRAAEEFDLGQ